MSALQRMGARLDNLALQLDGPNFEPDPERNSNSRVSDLKKLKSRVIDEILGERDAAMAELERSVDPENFVSERDRLDLEIGILMAEVAVQYWLVRDDATVGELMGFVAETVPESEVRDELLAGQRDMKSFAAITHARWLLRGREFDTADAVLKKVLKEVSAEPLKRTAKNLLGSPRPIKRAPMLGTVNGTGCSLYGHRDETPDGTYVATYCFCVLFIPLIPISAYRVFNNGDGSYNFYAKVPLSPLVRGSRWIVAALILLGALGGWASSYFNSPERRLSVAVSEAQALERAGQSEEALAAYDAILTNFYGEVHAGDLDDVAASVMSLTIARVEEPVDAERVDQLSRVVARYRSLPRANQRGRAQSLITEALERWAEQVGVETLVDARANLRLLELAEEVTHSEAKQKVRQRRQKIHLDVASKLVEEWPVEALEHYVEALPQKEAIAGSEPALRVVIGSSSLLMENEKLLRRWLDSSRGFGDSAELTRELTSKLDAAREYQSSSRRRELLESTDEETLRGALEQDRGDHEVASKLADVLRGQGDLEGAMKVLTGLGPPGHLSNKAQSNLVSCYLEAGELAEADALLERNVSRHLPAFQAARHRYDTKLQSTMDNLIQRLRSGFVPDDLQAQLIGVSESEQSQVVDNWLRSQIEHDSSLNRLRDDVEQYGEVVPAALSLGMVKLRRANEASGDERQELLAAAERLFLAIREDAEGVPSFHLGLGQVYYRLGRAEDGERELQGVLKRNDPDLDLQVAHAYRELQLVTKARQVAEAIWERGEDTKAHARGNAASLLGVMAEELEEAERWFERAPQESAFVRTSLVEVQARRAFREGQLQEADRLYAQAAEEHMRGAAHNSVAANNSAVATQGRFRCTGDHRHLRTAIDGLERALRMQPDSALTTMNLVGASSYLSQLEVLDTRLRTSVLRPEPAQMASLFAWCVNGPHREELREALRGNPDARRALELNRQSQVLAPSDTAGYLWEIRWYSTLDDATAMADLRRRVELVEHFDTSRIERWREEVLSGESDERRRRELETSLSIIDAALDRARRSHHAPTIAAALALKSDVLDSRALLEDRVEDQRAAVATLREARETSDELGLSSTLAWALVRLAILEIGDSNERIQRAWREDRNRYSTSNLVYQLIVGEGSDEVLAALRARPEIREAATIVREAEHRFDRGADWVLGRLAGDEELQRLGAEWLNREISRAAFEIVATVDSSDPNIAIQRQIRAQIQH